MILQSATEENSTQSAMKEFSRAHRKLRLTALISLLALSFGVSQAQTSVVLPLLQAEPATEQSSYEAGLKHNGVRGVDPNVYVYTQEFAKRFQLPMLWASEELKGADAMAFRVISTHDPLTRTNIANARSNRST